MAKFAKFAIYVFAGWLAWASWHAMPHFSGGLEEGLAYYRDGTSGLLEDCVAAGKRIRAYMQNRFESLRYLGRMTEESPSASRYRKLEEGGHQ